jgi:hypothetical protein
MDHTEPIPPATPFLKLVLTLLIAASLLVIASLPIAAQATQDEPSASPGAQQIFVHSKFGGRIFGFDIDQAGTEGVLAEAQDLSNGNVLAAVETFDQKTGKILSVVAKTETQDDFVTLGIVGNSVGLVEHEHVTGLFNVERIFRVINPMSANKFTSSWTPPIGGNHLINQISRTQGSPNAAVFAIDISSHFVPYIFSSDVASNTFGPVIKIGDSTDFGSVPPPIALNTATNTALLGGGPGCFGCIPVIGVADLTKGTFHKFLGVGFGFVNGIAVDSADNILCTTTEDDASVEFYDLKTLRAFTALLPGSGGNQFFSGADVEFDAVNKLFFVAQPNSSSSSSGSTIYAFDTKGNVKRILNGFNFSNTFSVIPVHIALNPATRSGYIDGPDANVTEIQRFTY